MTSHPLCFPTNKPFEIGATKMNPLICLELTQNNGNSKKLEYNYNRDSLKSTNSGGQLEWWLKTRSWTCTPYKLYQLRWIWFGLSNMTQFWATLHLAGRYEPWNRSDAMFFVFAHICLSQLWRVQHVMTNPGKISWCLCILFLHSDHTIQCM